MAFDPESAIIEHYGPTIVRLGVEGKWVEFMQFPDGKPKKKELMAIVEEMDRERTQ